jgi:predicted PurR-regulated permease PerM
MSREASPDIADRRGAADDAPTPILPSAASEAVITPAADGPEAPEPLVLQTPVDVRNLVLTVMGVLLGVVMLRYAESVLIPIVIGILISYALAPLVTGLNKLRVPRAIGAAIAVMLLVTGIGLGIYTLSDQAMAIVSSVPEAAQRARARMRLHRDQQGGALQKVQEAATEIDKAAQEASQSTEASKPPPRADGVQQVEVVPPPFKATDYLWSGGVGLMGFAGQFVLILFLVYFFLVTGDLYKRKLVKIAGPTLTQKKITVQILDDINQQIESFMRVQVLTSSVVAVATGAALWWFGLEQYIIWGLLAGIFNSIPYVGPLLVTGGLGVVTFVQFDDVLKTVYVCAVTFAITSLEGFILTPMLMGRAAQMNPVAIFVGLLFWSWTWGLWGTVLAVPMLMMLKAICDHVEDLRPIGELLGE